jgi:hypothetical protein
VIDANAFDLSHEYIGDVELATEELAGEVAQVDCSDKPLTDNHDVERERLLLVPDDELAEHAAHAADDDGFLRSALQAALPFVRAL